MCTRQDICPDLLMAGLALFAAIAFAALYIAITMVGRRRKRRDFGKEGEIQMVAELVQNGKTIVVYNSCKSAALV